MDKSCKDDSIVCENVEALGFVSVDEYISAEEVYDKAVEKNPFLKDVSVPGEKEAFQSYMKLTPLDLPTEEFLVIAKNSIMQIEDIDEVVFDPVIFNDYVKVKNIAVLLQKTAIVFALIMLVLFIVQSILFIIEKEEKHSQIYNQYSSISFNVIIGFCCSVGYMRFHPVSSSFR